MANIILTGFMGTGKTTVGKLLAQQLSYKFVDTDVFIEDGAGRSIADIFAELGETAFRQMENQAAIELANQVGLVISTGGGMLLDDGNVAVLERNGRIFCLTASPNEILARVQKDGETRPLLAGENPLERIAAILQDRKETYSQFEQIDSSGKTPIQIVDTIIEKMSS
ncbi:MAG: shikimate kinase [Chloroflexi bacterium]|nr:MAG: shikimate kinase [Chloroflexota bacterium]